MADIVPAAFLAKDEKTVNVPTVWDNTYETHFQDSSVVVPEAIFRGILWSRRWLAVDCWDYCGICRPWWTCIVVSRTWFSLHSATKSSVTEVEKGWKKVSQTTVDT
jgi:hypothetical protein